jgi:two-component system, sensor histidine kinase LadS
VIVMDVTNTEALLARLEQLELENSQLRQQLSISDSYFESYMNHTPTSAYIKDAEGRLLYINKTLNDAFDLSSRDWYGKNDFELWPEQDAKELRDLELRILNTGLPEDVVDCVEDDYHWITSKFRFSDNEGNYYIGGVGVDLTRQTKASKIFKEALNREKVSSDDKTEFLSLMSHELRTPLHSILSSAEQWDDAEDEQSKKELVSYIGFGAARLRSQVDNLVLLAETDSGDLRAGAFEFELKALVERIASCTRGLIEDTVNFQIDYDPALPDMCMGDPYLIEHMIRTVLENACKYTEYGEVMLFVHWDTHREHVIFRIEDSGCGMTERQQGRIYTDVIELSRGLNREAAGMGLGLTICCRLSALLHADLVMESLVGVGTKVEMSVPVQPLRRSLACIEEGDSYTGSILIVEDNPVNAKVLARMVGKLGYQVDSVDSGDAALKRLTDHVYSLIFMDIQMPVMDGITATRWIRRRGINTPIVAISCNSELDVRRRCMEHGVNDFLVKPARRSDVFRVLERQISSIN